MASSFTIPEPEGRLLKFLRIYCEATAIAAVSLGCAVLCGWALRIDGLKHALPDIMAMKPNTALALAFSGAALWVRIPSEPGVLKRRTADFLGLLTALIGVASLCEYLLGLDLRIDQFLFAGFSKDLNAISPLRMAPMTAVMFVAIGLALLPLDWKTRRGHGPAQALSLFAALIATIAIVGSIYHATSPHRIALYTQVAPNTSITLFLLSAAVFFARPWSGIAGVLTGDAPGSRMARRFLPVVFCIPILMGWIRLRRDLAGLYGTELGMALYATGTISVLAVLVWLAASRMNHEYSQRAAAETGMRKLNTELEGRVAERTRTLEQQAAVLAQQAGLLDLAQDAIVVRDMDKRIVFWNRAAEAAYGWLRAEVLGRKARELLKTEFSEPAEEIEAKLLLAGKWEGELFQYRRDGTRVLMASRWALQRDAAGAPVRVLSINNDITERRRIENSLRESNEKFEQLADNITDAFWIRSADMRELYYISPAFERIWGRTVESLHTNPQQWADFILPEDRERVRNVFAALTGNTKSVDVEYRIVRPDGEVRWVRVRGFQVRDAADKLIRLSGIVTEITERKQAEDALFAEKERAQVTLNSIGDAVICTDNSGIITFLNLVAEKMTGWRCQEAQGISMNEVLQILDATTHETIPNPIEGALEKNRTAHLPSNSILIRRDGLEIPIEDSVASIHDRAGEVTGAVLVFRDVSFARTMAQQMEHSAEHDFLTGLPNRMLLNDRVNQAIVLAARDLKKVAVLFLDLDGFKHINDSLGHAIGDKLLQSITKRLVDCVRVSDTVSRQGGDEFVVLLSEMGQAEDAALTARRMLQAVAGLHSLEHHDIHVTASIGVSVYPDDGLDGETLIKNADTAMYQAKENGRQSYQFFKPAMNVRAVARHFIEESLRRALERGEFALRYQPKVNLKTGKITGAEGLLRWTHPTRGPIAPAEFIPVAEDSGLIVPIGKWVLHEACKQAKDWVDAGLPAATMAVNISAMQFRQDDFLEGVLAILKETGLDPALLELELTESVLMKRAESAAMVLRELRSRGIQIAVDDFGTGYSSLSYLRKFPIDALKIDQSFVRQIATQAEDAGIVAAIISMGQSLNLRIVAEGVETEKELAFLQAHQCDEAQGYYFSRPVPPQRFATLLETGIPEAALR